MVKAKKHLTMEGLQKIVSYKASINLGLTDELKAAFPNTIPAEKYLSVNFFIDISFYIYIDLISLCIMERASFFLIEILHL